MMFAAVANPPGATVMRLLAQLGGNLAAAILRFSARIHIAHCSNVTSTLHNEHEPFPDNGPTDLAAVFRACGSIGDRSFIRTDRVLYLINERGKNDGYRLQSGSYAVGNTKGIMDPILRKLLP